MSHPLDWRPFPAVTPPANVPLWVTVRREGKQDFVGEFVYRSGGRVFADEFGTMPRGEVVAFIVLPGPAPA